MDTPAEDAADDFWQWAFALPPQPINPTSLEGAGTVCETKRFDSFYNEVGDRVILPAGLKYKSNNDPAYESAIAVTTYWNKLQDFEYTVLEIKSPHMKLALKTVVPEYFSFNIEVRHIVIKGEPRCLFHYRQELLNYGAWMEQDGKAEAATHVQHLIVYMWDVFAVETNAFREYELLKDNEPSLEHKYLWMVFRPEDIVYKQEPDCRAFVFKEMSLHGNMWVVNGQCVDYDGDNFGYRSYSASIESYDGQKSLREFSVSHFDWLPAEKRKIVKEQLVARGRRFVGIHGQRYLWYNGRSNRSTSGRMKTRFMADRKGYLDRGYGEGIYLLDEEKTFKADEALEKMKEVDLMLCTVWVAGYSLRDNEWDMFDIDSISEVTFDSEAFDMLILPPDQKQQILSLVRIHEDDSLSFDDLVKGKGRGMVFLLYGDAGVGKTLTAESVADYCGKPLLRIDAGSLGTTPSSVQKGLKNAFSLAERWHALLLLDEADVYLEQRRSKNLVHNGIVSVFLRMVEYYHGILFLTTNRIGSFDTSFTSRIHLAIQYPPLAQSSRRALLATFLKQASKESAESLSRQGVLDTLDVGQLNGRQIENLVRIACALALSDESTGGRIDRRHLETALRPMIQFVQTMEQVLLPGKHQDLSKSNDDEEDDKVGGNGGGYDRIGSEDFPSDEDGDGEEREDSSETPQSKRRRLLKGWSDN